MNGRFGHSTKLGGAGQFAGACNLCSSDVPLPLSRGPVKVAHDDETSEQARDPFARSTAQ